jgi:hypothetical protein
MNTDDERVGPNLYKLSEVTIQRRIINLWQKKQTATTTTTPVRLMNS